MLRFVIRLYLAALLALSAPAMAAYSCSWDRPGLNPFTGDRQRAIMSYTKIPLKDRFLLAWQVRFGKPDDLVNIGANGITGSPSYSYGDVRGMHFGRGQRCDTVSRGMWPLGHSEPADAYRRGSACIIVPRICGNVSWTTCDLTPRAALLEGAPRSVPEPGSIALVLLGLVAAALSRKRRRAVR